MTAIDPLAVESPSTQNAPRRRVLVTGAAGFAGSHLVEHILATTDWDIVALDGLTYAGDVQRFVDADGYDPARVKLLYHDLRSPIPPTVDHAIGPVDSVLHLAANSHVDRSIEDPAPFILANVAITTNLLEWVRERRGGALAQYIRQLTAHVADGLDLPAGVYVDSGFGREITHVVQISTDEVYGPAPDGYSHVEWDTVIPSNPYSASKAAQEAVAISYWRTYGVPIVITNTMNLFGERQGPEKFVPKVVKTILEGGTVPIHAGLVGDDVAMARIAGSVHSAKGEEQPLQVNGVTYHRTADGQWWRPGSRIWLHARNHADALCWILRETTPAAYPDADRPDRWHVAGQEEIDNLDLARRIAAYVSVITLDGKGPDDHHLELVDFHATRPGHDLRYSLDGSKIAAAGWTPPVSFDKALINMIAWTIEHQGWLQ